jgi:FtsH-binding integral membrane protein
MISRTLQGMGFFLYNNAKLAVTQLLVETMLSIVGLICGLYSYKRIDSPAVHFELILVMAFYSISILCLIPLKTFYYYVAVGISTVMLVIFLVMQVVLLFIDASTQEAGAAYKIATWIVIVYTLGALGTVGVPILLIPNIK